MAIVNHIAYSNLTTEILDAAFAYAGGKLASLHSEAGTIPTTTIGGFLIYDGDGQTDLVGFFGVGGNNYRCLVGAYAPDGSTAFGGAYAAASENVRVVATKTAVAIMSVDSNGVSKMGIVFTADNNNDICCVVCGADAQTLANPAVVPRDALYTQKIQYNATTSTDFGSTALSLIPVPSFDGSAKYLPNVAFAHAVQYVVDGSVTLGNGLWYSLGGSWYLADESES